MVGDAQQPATGLCKLVVTHQELLFPDCDLPRSTEEKLLISHAVSLPPLLSSECCAGERQTSCEVNWPLLAPSSLYVAHGTSAYQDQPSGMSCADSLELIFVHLSAIQSQICNLQAVAPLPKSTRLW